MPKEFYLLCLLIWSATAAEPEGKSSENEPPEGYYAFVESPNAEPPRVRPPPYTFTSIDCKEEEERKGNNMAEFNLCGDLNLGTIPTNPMGQNVMGHPYPFELIRNMTLKYFSRTLPILKTDNTLPKVAQLQEDYSQNSIVGNVQENDRIDRVRRNAKNENSIPHNDTITKKDITSEKTVKEQSRQSKKFCDEGGVFCTLYKAINGESGSSASTAPLKTQHLPLERRDENAQHLRYEGPPTPCPAKVEYATPVFAKNYQGVWRYVVQIPYEGYFTQTVEVTKCLQSKCHYLEGGCLSSPRWSSLLVAEIYYPDTILSSSDTVNPQRSPVAASQPPSVQDFQNYQQYLQKRAGFQPGFETTTSRTTHCDGVDALGCFQVRLYFDWFLIPGSCKCWRPDYFNKYVRRKGPNQDL